MYAEESQGTKNRQTTRTPWAASVSTNLFTPRFLSSPSRPSLPSALQETQGERGHQNSYTTTKDMAPHPLRHAPCPTSPTTITTPTTPITPPHPTTPHPTTSPTHLPTPNPPYHLIPIVNLVQQLQGWRFCHSTIQQSMPLPARPLKTPHPRFRNMPIQ